MLAGSDCRHAGPRPRRQRAMHDSVSMPTLADEGGDRAPAQGRGYVKDYRVVPGTPYSTLVIELKFGKNRERVPTNLKRVSRPGPCVPPARTGCHVFSAGSAPAILSTSSGLLTRPPVRREGRRRRGHLLRLVAMSRVGEAAPVEVPSTVSVAISPGRVQVNGPLGELVQQVPARMRSSRRRVGSWSRARPSAARTAPCTASPVRSSRTWSRGVSTASRSTSSSRASGTGRS